MSKKISFTVSDAEAAALEEMAELLGCWKREKPSVAEMVRGIGNGVFKVQAPWDRWKPAKVNGVAQWVEFPHAAWDAIKASVDGEKRSDVGD